MITKLATFSGVSDSGEPLVRPFPQGGSISKYAGHMMPEIRDWLSTYKSDKENVAVLISALGASEYWGQNSNGDHFRWGPLTHDCRGHRGVKHEWDDFAKKVIPAYGYWTFLQAHPFAHHRNKDAGRAFGSVPAVALNRRMRRVELVALVNRAKAREFGGTHVIDRIDAGDYPDCSMGCRVPYDVCLICGHKSKTRADYCGCVKGLGMGTILPDGRIVGVDNPHPRFFDISFVYIGADKTSKMMAKLGAAGFSHIPVSVLDAEELYGINQGDELVKAAMSPEAAKDVARGVYKTVRPVLPWTDDIAIMVAKQKQRDKIDRGQKKSKEKKANGDMLDYKMNQHNIEVGPPPKPNRKEYPFVGTIDYKGIRVHIENKRGQTREGTGPGGKKWKTHMVHHYGEIVGTKGVDHDKLDVYVGPEPNVREVYIVHQNHPGNHPKAGKYDEDKVMLGFASPDEAKDAYLRHYDRKDFFRSMTIMPFDQFKKSIYGEVKGEKVANELKKVAEELKLEDLFNTASFARRRERTWRDKVTGKETNHIGSGLGTSFRNMAKTASVEAPGLKDEEIWGSTKVSALKNAEQKKWAEILKRIYPKGNAGRVIDDLSDREPECSHEMLNEMGRGDLRDALSTTSGMGMVLKPREFQRMMLSHAGKSEMADDLDERGVTFGPPRDGEEEAPCEGLGRHHMRHGLMQKLMPLLRDKSYFGPVVRKRIIVIRIKPQLGPSPGEEDSPLLSKIGAAYNWYRREMLKVAADAEAIMATNPQLQAAVMGVDTGDVFSKEAVSAKTLAPLGAFPATLMYSAHLRGEGQKGRQLSSVQRFLANHPYVSSLGTAAALRQLLKGGVTPKG